jgi:hypothetical protein
MKLKPKKIIRRKEPVWKEENTKKNLSSIPMKTKKKDKSWSGSR